MASLKGGTSLYAAATNIGVAGSATAKSSLGLIGPGPYVAVYIENGSAISLTFKIQASAVVNPEAGRNGLDSTDADGGLNWFDYTGPGGDGAETTLTVAAGASICVDLSPFAPPFIRLVRTDAGAATSGVTAFVTCTGPN